MNFVEIKAHLYRFKNNIRSCEKKYYINVDVRKNISFKYAHHHLVKNKITGQKINSERSKKWHLNLKLTLFLCLGLIGIGKNRRRFLVMPHQQEGIGLFHRVSVLKCIFRFSANIDFH